MTQWRLFIFISRESKWGTLQSAGNPRCAVPAEIHSICTDRPRPGPAAGLQVSPTSDTSQSVAILMNRPHSIGIQDHSTQHQQRHSGRICVTQDFLAFWGVILITFLLNFDIAPSPSRSLKNNLQKQTWFAVHLPQNAM